MTSALRKKQQRRLCATSTACQAAQPAIAQALQGRSDITHLQIEDGQGQALGRSFHVRLWPTLIVLQHGQELARVVRPATAQAVQHILPLPGS